MLPQVDNSRNNLLSSIRAGFQLKPVRGRALISPCVTSPLSLSLSLSLTFTLPVPVRRWMQRARLPVRLSLSRRWRAWRVPWRGPWQPAPMPSSSAVSAPPSIPPPPPRTHIVRH